MPHLIPRSRTGIEGRIDGVIHPPCNRGAFSCARRASPQQQMNRQILDSSNEYLKVHLPFPYAISCMAKCNSFSYAREIVVLIAIFPLVQVRPGEIAHTNILLHILASLRRSDLSDIRKQAYKLSPLFSPRISASSFALFDRSRTRAIGTGRDQLGCKRRIVPLCFALAEAAIDRANTAPYNPVNRQALRAEPARTFGIYTALHLFDRCC